MGKRFSVLLVILTIVSGLIGGLISGRIFAVNPAMAVEAKQSKVLTAEELRIVDKDGKLLIKLGKNDKDPLSHGLFIFDDSGDIKNVIGVDKIGNGYVIISGKSGYAMMGSLGIGFFSLAKGSHIEIFANETGGIVSVFGGNNGSAGMSVDEKGSRISVFGKDDKSSAQISVNEYGGRFDVYGKIDNKSRASMSVNEYGYGAIGLWDKDGYRLK